MLLPSRPDPDRLRLGANEVKWDGCRALVLAVQALVNSQPPINGTK
jgi:hypothetical protein